MVSKQENPREAWSCQTVDGLRVLFLRCDSRVPVCMLIPPHYSVFNATIGASVGTIVQCMKAKSGQDTLDLWVDDEGLIGPNAPRSLNASASMIAGQPIFGDALLMSHDRDGSPVDLPQDVILIVVEEILEVDLTQDKK